LSFLGLPTADFNTLAASKPMQDLMGGLAAQFTKQLDELRNWIVSRDKDEQQSRPHAINAVSSSSESSQEDTPTRARTPLPERAPRHQHSLSQESPAQEQETVTEFQLPAALPTAQSELVEESERRRIPSTARVLLHSNILEWNNVQFLPDHVGLSQEADGRYTISIPADLIHNTDLLALHNASSPYQPSLQKRSDERFAIALDFLDNYISEKTGWHRTDENCTVSVEQPCFNKLYEDLSSKVCMGTKPSFKSPPLHSSSNNQVFKFLQAPKLNNDFNASSIQLSGIFNELNQEDFNKELGFRQRAFQAVKILETLGTIHTTLECIPELSLANPPSTLPSKLASVNSLLSYIIDTMKDLTSFHLNNALAAKMSLRLKAVGSMEPEVIKKNLTMSDLLQPKLFSSESMEKCGPLVAQSFHMNFKPAHKRASSPTVNPTVRKKPRLAMPRPFSRPSSSAPPIQQPFRQRSQNFAKNAQPSSSQTRLYHQNNSSRNTYVQPYNKRNMHYPSKKDQVPPGHPRSSFPKQN